MLTSPSNREAMAEPRSLRKRDSHTRQYCSPHSPRLHHGAWNEPGRKQLCFLLRGSGTHKSSVFTSLYVKGVLSLCKTECGFQCWERASWIYVKPKHEWFVFIINRKTLYWYCFRTLCAVFCSDLNCCFPAISSMFFFVSLYSQSSLFF